MVLVLILLIVFSQIRSVFLSLVCYSTSVEFSLVLFVYFFFFFQAEDGIRDWSVTGVQTCALPISLIDGFDLFAGRETAIDVLHQAVGELHEIGPEHLEELERARAAVEAGEGEAADRKSVV